MTYIKDFREKEKYFIKKWSHFYLHLVNLFLFLISTEKKNEKRHFFLKKKKRRREEERRRRRERR